MAALLAHDAIHNVFVARPGHTNSRGHEVQPVVAGEALHTKSA